MHIIKFMQGWGMTGELRAGALLNRRTVKPDDRFSRSIAINGLSLYRVLDEVKVRGSLTFAFKFDGDQLTLETARPTRLGRLAQMLGSQDRRQESRGTIEIVYQNYKCVSFQLLVRHCGPEAQTAIVNHLAGLCDLTFDSNQAGTVGTFIYL